MRSLLGITVIAAIVAACGEPTDTVPPTAQIGDLPMTGSFTRGLAHTLTDNLLDCPGGRVAAVGTVTAHDDTTWIVPASTVFETGPRAADLYNECGGTMLASSAEIDLEAIPITEIDADGDVITSFDDHDWPGARTFTNETVGVDNKPAYTNFLDIWDDPEFDPVFIWSDSLVLDNLVLVRGRIGS